MRGMSAVDVAQWVLLVVTALCTAGALALSISQEKRLRRDRQAQEESAAVQWQAEQVRAGCDYLILPIKHVGAEVAEFVKVDPATLVSLAVLEGSMRMQLKPGEALEVRVELTERRPRSVTLSWRLAGSQTQHRRHIDTSAWTLPPQPIEPRIR